MRIRLLVGLSGPAYSLGPGDERDFPQGEALRLVEAGYAVPVSEPDVELAVKAPAPELRDVSPVDAAPRPGRRKKR